MISIGVIIIKLSQNDDGFYMSKHIANVDTHF